MTGLGDYAAHVSNAQLTELFGIRVRVAGLSDLIASKETLGRAKDLSVLDELRQLRDSEA